MAAKTAFTPGYLSMVERGHRPVTAAVISAYRTMLSDPTLGLSDVDVDRLAASTTHPDGAGTSSLVDVSVILERTRHLEDTVGATLVVPVIRGIDGVARALASERAGGAAAAAAAAEVTRYRGIHAVQRHILVPPVGKINELHTIITDVVETARTTLVIGAA
jgi:hypothetical protein